MGLLDNLWDDTLAILRHENGLGKLRKNGGTNSAMENPSTPEFEEGLNRLRKRRSSAEFQELNDEVRQVTQSITIVKPPGYLRSLFVDIPSSQAASIPLNSPSSLNHENERIHGEVRRKIITSLAVIKRGDLRNPQELNPEALRFMTG